MLISEQYTVLQWCSWFLYTDEPEIQNRINSANRCVYACNRILSTKSLSHKTKTRIYKTITGGERKEETWPVLAHSCVLVCYRAVISGASPHSRPCESFILAMELFVFSNVAFLQSVTHLKC
ncbi:hypothetical protein J6590_065187 [Homalodisca vitripennis]|nr:hypothetical protein J6590_065187 [Homalodisca vitripennis]